MLLMIIPFSVNRKKHNVKIEAWFSRFGPVWFIQRSTLARFGSARFRAYCFYMVRTEKLVLSDRMTCTWKLNSDKFRNKFAQVRNSTKYVEIRLNMSKFDKKCRIRMSKSRSNLFTEFKFLLWNQIWRFKKND